MCGGRRASGGIPIWCGATRMPAKWGWCGWSTRFRSGFTRSSGSRSGTVNWNGWRIPLWIQPALHQKLKFPISFDARGGGFEAEAFKSRSTEEFGNPSNALKRDRPDHGQGPSFSKYGERPGLPGRFPRFRRANPGTALPEDGHYPLAGALHEVCLDEESPGSLDENSPDATGIGPAPLNHSDGTRMSLLLSYLSQAQQRLSLTIRTNAPVRRILFDSVRAVQFATALCVDSQRLPTRKGHFSAALYITDWRQQKRTPATRRGFILNWLRRL